MISPPIIIFIKSSIITRSFFVHFHILLALGRPKEWRSLKTIEEERLNMPKFKRISKVTEKIYNEAKPFLNTPRDDIKAMRMFGFSDTTARKIRNTKNFAEYDARTRKDHRYKKQLAFSMPEPRKCPPIPADITDLDGESEIIKVQKDLEDDIFNATAELKEEIMNLKIASTLIAIVTLAAIMFLVLK